jgi:hypothetical protein
LRLTRGSCVERTHRLCMEEDNRRIVRGTGQLQEATAILHVHMNLCRGVDKEVIEVVGLCKEAGLQEAAANNKPPKQQPSSCVAAEASVG